MRGILAAVLLLLIVMVPLQLRADGLEAGGVEFEPTISVGADTQQYRLRCTGTALRKKFFFKVYAIAAYIESETETGADPGAGFIAADVPKRVHLQMLRDVESKKVVEAINEALDKCSTSPVEEIADDRQRFLDAFSMAELTKGQDVRFTWMPGAGLQITVDHNMLDTIENPVFAQSFFEIYFGPVPVDDGMKEDLLQLEG